MKMGEIITGSMLMFLLLISFSNWTLELAGGYGLTPTNATYLSEVSRFNAEVASMRSTLNQSTLEDSTSSNIISVIPATYNVMKSIFTFGDILGDFITGASTDFGIPADLVTIIISIISVAILFIFLRAVLGRDV